MNDIHKGKYSISWRHLFIFSKARADDSPQQQYQQQLQQLQQQQQHRSSRKTRDMSAPAKTMNDRMSERVRHVVTSQSFDCNRKCCWCCCCGCRLNNCRTCRLKQATRSRTDIFKTVWQLPKIERRNITTSVRKYFTPFLHSPTLPLWFNYLTTVKHFPYLIFTWVVLTSFYLTCFVILISNTS